MKPDRLDILLYCHDGRGIGHTGRSVAIGMAIRRLFPKLRVLLVTGSPHVESLRAGSGLDWLKLPGYETTVKNGKSRGIDGKSNYADKALGILRSKQLQDIVNLYRPRVILADHSPMGKHKELLPSLQASQAFGSVWYLGVRGVIGRVRQVQSSLARETFDAYYTGLLWYGDQEILGNIHIDTLTEEFNTPVEPMGYVSRMREVMTLDHQSGCNEKKYAGTIALPWFDEHGLTLVDSLYHCLAGMGDTYGKWVVFHPVEADRAIRKALQKLAEHDNTIIRQFGPEYLPALAQSRTAVIHGGYNSLTDVLYCRIPALVLLRNMQDKEQQEHVGLLVQNSRQFLTPVAGDEMSSAFFREKILELLSLTATDRTSSVNLEGAEKTARFLADTISC